MKKNIDIDQIIEDFPLGAINWYDVSHIKTVLIITINDNKHESSLFIKWFQSQRITVSETDWETSISASFLNENKSAFDAIFAVHTIEYIKNPIEILKAWKLLVNSNGRLILGTDNRLGLRFFCGDRDPFTNRSFDSIENYRRVGIFDRKLMSGQLYSKIELNDFLKEAGWTNKKWYSVFPNLEMPQLIFSEDTLPKEELDMRLFPKYNYPDSVFLEEQFLYTDAIKNGYFHSMANSYFIECSLDHTFDDVDFVTLSMDRGRERSFATIMRNEKTVEKKPLYDEGFVSVEQLHQNMEDLKNHGIPTIEGSIKDNRYVMPYVDQQLAITYLRDLAFEDIKLFIEEIDRFTRIIRKSSTIIEEKQDDGRMVELLQKGYVDLVPWNCFYQNGKYLFFDQEFYKDNYPLNAILYRFINLTYTVQLEQRFPRTFFWEKYGFSDRIHEYAMLENDFINEIRFRKDLRVEMEKFQPDSNILHTNRQRMNYSSDEFKRKFVEIFPKNPSKPIILFGSGNFTKKFLELFKKDYPIEAIIDNSESKWGSTLNEIPIYSPDYLETKNKGDYHLIICIKNYTGVCRQLENRGIVSYGIYDPNTKYARVKPVIVSSQPDTSNNMDIKPYNTGYIAGVFDLFHIGHINLLKAAKTQCNHLIVGVVSDKGVLKYKDAEPYIPCDERKAVLEACRYVDEVVEIPLESRGTRDAYNLYQFDCQFSGSDYENDPNWLADKAYLQKQGSDMVFLPYTKQTSSSKIKNKLGAKK